MKGVRHSSVLKYIKILNIKAYKIETRAFASKTVEIPTPGVFTRNSILSSSAEVAKNPTQWHVLSHATQLHAVG